MPGRTWSPPGQVTAHNEHLEGFRLQESFGVDEHRIANEHRRTNAMRIVVGGKSGIVYVHLAESREMILRHRRGDR